MKSKTVDGVRYFTCRLCGAQIEDPLKSWKKKSRIIWQWHLI